MVLPRAGFAGFEGFHPAAAFERRRAFFATPPSSVAQRLLRYHAGAQGGLTRKRLPSRERRVLQSSFLVAPLLLGAAAALGSGAVATLSTYA